MRERKRRRTPPPGAFAFEMPTLNAITATPKKAKTSDPLPDAFERESANERRYQRRALLRVLLTDPPADAPDGSQNEAAKKQNDDDDASVGFVQTPHPTHSHNPPPHFKSSSVSVSQTPLTTNGESEPWKPRTCICLREPPFL